ncbi:unnamed protein product, partial [Mesorhabditis belari]|uniref:Uncharacterized protein n=1 Tax=Mesorhabditis belari TaxID=2138241 RepID=A0AAF3FGZ2_9BILA
MGNMGNSNQYPNSLSSKNQYTGNQYPQNSLSSSLSNSNQQPSSSISQSTNDYDGLPPGVSYDVYYNFGEQGMYRK